MPTTVNVSPLKINYLTESQYQTALNNGEINSDELYFTPSVDCLPLTEGGTGATNAADARTNLGAAAASHTHTMTQLSGTLSISQGGTGAITAATARVSLGITPENIGAAASDHSHNLFDLRGPLTIEKGGTGQTTRVGAMNALSDLGTVPITSTTNDTTANWEALRTGVAWYNATGKLNDQPTQYGLLLNINTSSSVHDVHQLWFTQADGNILHRGGNASGWGSNSWRTLLDSVNYTSFVTPANIGAATASHTHSYLPLSGGTMTGTITLAATGLKTPNTGGYTTDSYGNFKHQTTSTNNNWAIINNAGTGKFLVYYENGNTEIKGTLTVAGKLSCGAGLALDDQDAWRTALGINGLNWSSCYLGSATTTAQTYTVSSGTWLIITGHNSTAALNTLTMLRVGGPRIMPIYTQASSTSTSSGYTMNGNIGFKLSGNTLTVIATAGGSASVYGIFLG